MSAVDLENVRSKIDAIDKEIINAHKTTIDVISTEGTGTGFIFSLPKTKVED